MVKKFDRGLVIGKFYPFHTGHQYLINQALHRSNKVTVIVCQTDRYLIPAEIRSSWIKSTFPQADVRILHHGPELDSDSSNISKIWAELTVNFLGFTPNAVFTSENYGKPYATHMGSKHIMVDRNRSHFPISGTKVRANPYLNWSYLPLSTRSYFLKKVVCLGAESTGTTTLSIDLAKYYQTVWVPEYGRLYYEGKMFSSNSQSWTTAEFVHIATAQNNLEDAFSQLANKVLICDTNSFATELWHQRYVGTMSPEVQQLSANRHPDLYILTNTDIPFVQDGTRDGKHIRQSMHQQFLAELDRRHQKYIVVSGSKEDRLSAAITEINKLLIF